MIRKPIFRLEIEIFLIMKTLISLTSGILLLFIAATCQNLDNSIKVSGTLEKQGITTYQYGTHTLTTDGSFYALTSNTVDLEEYIGQEVSIKAEKIEGYPVDGGPEYLRVLEIN